MPPVTLPEVWTEGPAGSAAVVIGFVLPDEASGDRVIASSPYPAYESLSSDPPRHRERRPGVPRELCSGRHGSLNTRIARQCSCVLAYAVQGERDMRQTLITLFGYMLALTPALAQATPAATGGDVPWLWILVVVLVLGAAAWYWFRIRGRP